MPDRYLFQDRTRKTRPLSTRGVSELVIAPSVEAARRLRADDLSGRTDADVAGALVSAVWQPPELLSGAQPMRVVNGDPIGTITAPSVTSMRSTKRITLSWAISGNGRWLEYWPDLDDEDLLPTDLEFGETDGTDPAWRADWNRRLHLAERFRVNDHEVTSYVEIPTDESHPKVARNTAIEAETKLLRAFVAACQATADAVRANAESAVCEAVAARRRDLSWHQELVEGLELPSRQTIVLTATEPEPNASPLELPPPQLTDPSRLAILEVIAVWVERASQYPRTFRKLKEDELSDLLAASLGLVFGVAEREVFSYQGKTDIRLPVSAIRRLKGESPAIDKTIAFVIEAKVGTGAELANKAKRQLDRYIPSAAVQGALIFYASVQDVGSAQGRMLDALRGRSDYLGEDSLDGSPFPILRFRNSKTSDVVSVAVIVVPLAS